MIKPNRDLTPIERLQRACDDGYLLFGDGPDRVFDRWGELAIEGRFPLVTAAPQQNGQAWVGFTLAGHGHDHQLVMNRAKRAIASVSQVFEVQSQQMSSVLMPQADAFALAHKLARLTSYKFPVPDSLIEAAYKEAS